MTTTTRDVVNGYVLPDVSAFDLQGAIARQREVERLLPATRGAPHRLAEREALRAEIAALVARIGELREAEKRENLRRNFAGIGSPLHEAIAARFDPVIVRDLEADALARHVERERKSAERKAAKPR